MDNYSSNARAPMRARVIISYVADYVIIIILAAIFFALDAVTPFHQHFALQNYTLQYPYAEKERVPVWALGIIAVLAPAVIIAFYTLVIDGLFSHHKNDKFPSPHGIKARLWELNCGILGLLLASGTAFVITGALKNATGKPRPDFIARCQPPAGSVDPPLYGLSSIAICTQTDQSIMKDAFRSFPSGHSSSSFGGLFFLSLYLAGKLHLYDQRGEVWKVFLCIIPTLGAALVAISRIEDARHHPFDVLFGSALGALCAWGSYRQYFPSLNEAWKKGQAYPIRSWGTGPARPDETHWERDAARNQGREPLRATSLPRTDDEYEPFYSSNPYSGSNVRKQIVNPPSQGDHPVTSVPDELFGAVGMGRDDRGRRPHGRREEGEEEETEMVRMPRDNSAMSKSSGTPFVANLQNLPYNR